MDTLLIQQIENLIINNKFEHFYLYNFLIESQTNNYEVNAKWVKQEDENSWILGYCANNNYHIYGLNYSKELLETVKKEFSFSELTNGTFISGNKEIIDYLLSHPSDIQFELLKDRFLYEIESDNYKNLRIKSNIKIAGSSEVESVTKLYQKFFIEEYEGENNKNYEEVKSKVSSMIMNNNIIIALEKKEIIGFCTKMDTLFNNDMIGAIYVEKAQRSIGIGKQLLTEMTKSILSNNKFSWLMTDMKNISSNKLVETIGYSKILKYTSGTIKKL